MSPNNFESLNYVLPEILVILSMILLIVLGLLGMGQKKGLMTTVTVAALAITFYAVTTLYGAGERRLFEGMMALDGFSLFFKMLFIVSTILAALFALETPDIVHRRYGEFCALLLAVTLGGFMMVSATNLLMMYLALEMVSIPCYILAGFQKEMRRSNEAAVKYVIYGGVSSGIMIYGMSLIYGMTGTMDLYQIAGALVTAPPYPLALFVGLLFVMAGFGYKVAAVPFHFWCPDVYEGAPTPVTAFLSIAPKAAGFAMLGRFFYTGFTRQVGSDLAFTVVDWSFLLAVTSAFTVTLGNAAAIWQDNLKRLLAYSSIAHAGYLMMGLVSMSPEGLRAMIFYFMAYLLMNMGAFMVVMMMARKLDTEDIHGYRGLGVRSPFAAISFTIFLFSLAGIPPTAGLIGKVYLFTALIERERYWLAVVGVFNGVVALFYYARIIRAMYFEEPETRDTITLPAGWRFTLVLMAAPTVLFGIFWEPLIHLADRSLRMLAGP